MQGNSVFNADGSPMTLLQVNQEQPMWPIYDYAVITDAVEGLVLVNVETMSMASFATTSSAARASTMAPRRGTRTVS